MASPMPLSARDAVEFRPAQAAVIAARAALEKAQAAQAASVNAIAADGEPLGKPQADADAVVAAAQAALEAAEAEAAKADPIFRLRVPTGRTRALVNHATQADPAAPRFRDNAELLQAIEAEAVEAGLLDSDLAAIAEAKPLVAAGQSLEGELWTRIFNAARDTVAGRRIIADRNLWSELYIRHRVAHHLILSDAAAPLASYRPLSERDLDSIDQRHLLAIATELDRLSNLTAADAKNSDAP